MGLKLFPWLLAAYESVVNSTNSMYLPMLPTVANDLLTSETNIQRTVSIWFTGASVSQIFFGPLSDYKGRRFVLLLGGIIFLIATLGCALSQTITALACCRFFEGVGVCTLTAAGYLVIHESYKEKEGVKVLATLGAVSELTPLLGPFVSSWMLYQFGWRTVFVLLFVLGIFTILGLSFVMPETNKKLDPLALNPLHFFKRYIRILRRPTFLLFVLSYGFLYAGITAWATTSPFLLMNFHGLAAGQYSLVQIPIGISYISATLLVKKLANTRSLEKIIDLGLKISTLGSLLFIFTGLFFPKNLNGTIISMMIYCAGCGLSFSCFNRKIVFSLQENLGAIIAVQDLGMIGIAAIGSFVATCTYGGTPSSMGITIFSMVGVSLIFNFIRARLYQ